MAEKERLIQEPNETHLKAVEDHPWKKANILSRLFFWWLLPLLRKGYSSDLQLEDMYNVTRELSASYLAKQLESEWGRELKRSKIQGRQPSLLRTFVRLFGAEFMYLATLATVRCILKFTAPVLVIYISSYFVTVPSISSREAYMYCAVFGIVVVTNQIVCTHPYFFGHSVLGTKIMVAVKGIIFRKAMRLDVIGNDQTSVGQIVNILANDVNRFGEVCQFLSYMVTAPLTFIAIFGILWFAIGSYSLVLLSGVFMSYTVLVSMGTFTSEIRLRTALLTDERVGVMKSIISGMRVVKIYTWEKPFAELVRIARRKEVNTILQSSYLRAINETLSSVITSVITCITFVSYSLAGNILLPSKIFIAIPYINVARFDLEKVSRAVMYGMETTVSINRIQKFLELEELELRTTKQRAETIDKAYSSATIDTKDLDQKEEILVKHLSSSWTSVDELALNDISFSVKSGELLAVIGPVGAGKTSLLMALLGEMPSQTGTALIQGKIAYTSQLPWIFSGTLRNNILFNQPFDKSKYESVIKNCALEKDLQQLPEGDLTLVGEKGVTLSGGQRARVSLARAMYSNADVFLLDDPLGAVDTGVGRHLFEECICGVLANKARILITHQLQYLHSADQILILKWGQAVVGTYKELERSGVDFAELLKERNNEPEYFNEVDVSIQRKRTISDASDTSSLSVDSEMEYEDLGQVSGEEIAIGSIGSKAYITIFLTGSSALFFVAFMIINIAGQAATNIADLQLTRWAFEEEKALNSTYMIGRLATLTASREYVDSVRYAWIYGLLVAAQIVLVHGRTTMLYFLMVNSSRKLHNQMFDVILRAPMQFFDTNPVGRILNRFAKDIGILDDILPVTMSSFNSDLCSIFGTVIFVCAVNPIALVLAVPLFFILCLCGMFYVGISRNLARLEGIARSPVFSHLSDALEGLPTIRAFEVQGQFCEIFDKHQDLHTRAAFLFFSSTRWFAIHMDLINNIFIIGLSFSCVIATEIFSLDSELVGLSLVYSLTMLDQTQWCIRLAADIENQMTSTERVIQYIDIATEAPLIETGCIPPEHWPEHGCITFEEVSLRYSQKSPLVLRGILCCIHAEEKVGIVGRTGAGKSSLMEALLRLAEPEGTITIDGVDITKIGLHSLRQKLSFITQDPVLFNGTFRKNLDLFDEHKDLDIWAALEEVQLKVDIENLENGLETNMADGGTNFSVGQRQLVCLARAILRKSKILIVDEATANVDLRTDMLIQTAIRRRFIHCTVLTIAHRLNTVMDSDRILVLDNGRMVEFDKPYILLQKQESLLTTMVMKTGKTESAKLIQMAKEKYELCVSSDTLSGDDKPCSVKSS